MLFQIKNTAEVPMEITLTDPDGYAYEVVLDPGEQSIQVAPSCTWWVVKFVSSAATKPAIEATKPAIEATKPAIEATKPAIEATKPAIEATKPAIEATKPAIEATKPAIEATKPATK